MASLILFVKPEISFAIVVTALRELSPASIWFRKTSFFNLVVELVLFKRKHGLFPDKNNLKRLLERLENDIILHKDDKAGENEYAEYYFYTFSGTASRKARFTRGELIRKNLETLK